MSRLATYTIFLNQMMLWLTLEQRFWNFFSRTLFSASHWYSCFTKPWNQTQNTEQFICHYPYCKQNSHNNRKHYFIRRFGLCI